MKSIAAHAARLLALLVLAALALQLFFALRIATMAVLDPQSTTFQRAEAWRLLSTKHSIAWSQQWADYPRISDHLKRAVIASEDAGFAEHSGVEWDALEKAWERNQKAEARVEKINAQIDRRLQKAPPAKAAASKPVAHAQAKVVGGSTITQQLAKNLFLSGERNLLRKGQEFAITFMLEALLSKQRILEIYLNSVEWGEGVFGAEAAARHYFRVDARALSTGQAAQLAVLLPAPKRFEKRPGSAYVVGRAGTIAARMGGVELP
jgi:monofunctional biosynthetic peptidoglycan transglycosylase